jgi:hypothetical protein
VSIVPAPRAVPRLCPRPRGTLSNTYAGVSGDAAIGIGLGANVLVGGSNRSIALQPLSVQAEAGLNLALGVAGLELDRIR